MDRETYLQTEIYKQRRGATWSSALGSESEKKKKEDDSKIDYDSKIDW